MPTDRGVITIERQIVGPDRRRDDLSPTGAERVGHGVGDRGRTRHRRALAGALEAERIERRRRIAARDTDRGDAVGARKRIVHQGSGEHLTARVVDDLLPERRADALDSTALRLPLHEERVDLTAGIVDGVVREHGDRAGLAVDLDGRDVDPGRPRHALRAHVTCRREARLAENPDGVRALREPRELDQAEPAIRRARDVGPATGDHDVLRVTLEGPSRDASRLVAHRLGRLRYGVAHDDGDTARVSAGARGEARGVAPPRTSTHSNETPSPSAHI
jgi:hypothetical protein